MAYFEHPINPPPMYVADLVNHHHRHGMTHQQAMQAEF